MMKFILVLSVVAISIFSLGCAEDSNVESETDGYKVHRLAQGMKIDGNWDKPEWQGAPPIYIRNYMGTEPAFQPKVQAKALYDDYYIYIIFRVEDQYVKAVAQNYHDSVCRDSCVEFFFTPNDDPSTGYFNMEVNCGGTALFHHQKTPGGQTTAIATEDMDKIEIAHTMPKIVDPEITEPVTWTLEYRLSLAMLEKYSTVVKPKSGVAWTANFYKCADATSHPHWLTWAVVDYPTPRFHMPEFFGTLTFE